MEKILSKTSEIHDELFDELFGNKNKKIVDEYVKILDPVGTANKILAIVNKKQRRTKVTTT